MWVELRGLPDTSVSLGGVEIYQMNAGAKPTAIGVCIHSSEQFSKIYYIPLTILGAWGVAMNSSKDLQKVKGV